MQDLLTKLQSDLAKLRDRPADAYLAYNLFVTAEHMLDWVWPGNPGGAAALEREKVRQSEALLQVVSHLATGAKHFQPNPKKHHSVKTIEAGSYGVGPYGAGPYGGDLLIQLDGVAAKTLGSSVSVLDLATKVVDYWTNSSYLQKGVP